MDKMQCSEILHLCCSESSSITVPTGETQSLLDGVNDRKRLELSTVLAYHVCTDGCEFNYFCAGGGEAEE